VVRASCYDEKHVKRPTKEALRRELLAQLEAHLETARAAHASATEGAISDDARPENDKDTRGLEQSYLARGIAGRVAELEAAVESIAAMTLAKSTRVAIGALVTVEQGDADKERTLYIAPHGGGLTLSGDITVVTPTSPMGRALLGKVVDDDAELVTGGTTRSLTITAIA
jgi:transcription elongation GreA/GreB family factor